MRRTYLFIKLFLPMITLCAFASIGNATGFIAGKLIVLLGRRTAPYEDAEEFELKPEYANHK